MSLDKIITLIVGVIGIIGTYWFFLMRKDTAVEVTESVDIMVDGGYSPNTISLQKGQTTQINFFRKDPSTCLEEIVLADFKIRKYLLLNKTTSIAITPTKSGTFDMVCGMNMFHGKIVVK